MAAAPPPRVPIPAGYPPAPAAQVPAPNLLHDECADARWMRATLDPAHHPLPCTTSVVAGFPQTPRHWDFRFCVAPNPPGQCLDNQGQPFMPCGRCSDHIYGLNIPPILALRRGINRVNPEAPGPPVNALPWNGPPQNLDRHHIGASPWQGYLTRMCARCERACVTDAHNKQIDGTPAAPPATPAGTHPERMHDWIWHTCTCMWHLGLQWTGGAAPSPERWCFEDRLHWAGVLNDRKNHNDMWLRTLARNTSGQICRAKNSRLRARLQPPRGNGIYRNGGTAGAYRACRCGAEPVTHAAAEVLQCMACEGIVHMRRPNVDGFTWPQGTLPSNYTGPFGPTTRRAARATALVNLRLGRPYEAPDPA